MTEFIIMEDFLKNGIEFDQRCLDKSACYNYLFKMKWSYGFSCTKCSHSAYWLSSKNLYICTRCGHQHSLTAGTIMDSSKKPIKYWFKAMCGRLRAKQDSMRSSSKSFWDSAAMIPLGIGFKSLDAVRSIKSEKNFPVTSKSMNFSSVVKSPENAAGAQMVKLP